MAITSLYLLLYLLLIVVLPRGSYQRKLLTVLYSGGSNPLEIWDIQVKNGWTRRVKDEEMGTIVFEVCGTNVATAYIVSPPTPRGALGISLPFITMLIKNLKRYFTFEIQILDDKRMRRRFRFSNYQSSTKVRPFTCSVPLALKPGWNQMQLNLANFTMRAYGTNYMETQRIQIHANCRIRRVYFSDRLYAEEELPRDYRIYLNVRQAPRPPVEEPQEQALPRDTIKAGPSSILRMPSKVEGTFSEMEVGKTSFKSGVSLADHPLPKTGSSVVQVGQRRSTHSKQRTTIIGDGPQRTSKASVPKMSHRATTLPGEETIELEKPSSVTEEVIQEEELPTATDKDESPEEVVGELPGDVVEHEEVVELSEEVVELSEEVVKQDDMEREEIVEEALDTEPEESTVADSPRTEVTESEYAESEPVPESDLELEDSEPPTD